MSKISIIGASGHAKVIVEIIEKNNDDIGLIVDSDPLKESLLNYPVTHEMGQVQNPAVVAIGNNSIRKLLVEKFQFTVKPIIHPNTNISKSSKIGDGTVVMAGVSINADVTIGNHAILNTNSSIDHDCVIGNFVHVSPNVSLAGNVHVGDGTHLGIGSCVIQGIKIGRNCVIGAGSVVIRDVEDNTVVVGNPAKAIKKK